MGFFWEPKKEEIRQKDFFKIIVFFALFKRSTTVDTGADEIPDGKVNKTITCLSGANYWSELDSDSTTGSWPTCDCGDDDDDDGAVSASAAAAALAFAAAVAVMAA